MKDALERMSEARIHDLKCEAEAWEAIDLGMKKAEVRLNDRDYRPNDVLVLRRLDHAGAVDPELVGAVRVLHVYEGGRHGIEAGYVLLSFSVCQYPERIAALQVLRERAEAGVK